MAEQTHHAEALADLVHERNNLVNSPMMNLATNYEDDRYYDHQAVHDRRDYPQANHHEQFYAEPSHPVYHDALRTAGTREMNTKGNPGRKFTGVFMPAQG